MAYLYLDNSPYLPIRKQYYSEFRFKIVLCVQVYKNNKAHEHIPQNNNLVYF